VISRRQLDTVKDSLLMQTIVDRALAADVAESAAAVTNAALLEVQRQADLLMGVAPVPGTPAWHDEAASGFAAQRQRAWQLTCLRIELAAGMEGFEEVLSLRRLGATWSQIGLAAGSSRQAAHERWGSRVLAVLNRYGAGDLGGPVPADETDLTCRS
jgi:hypothetical protein